MFVGGNLMLLDEPTNHLDVYTREALEEALERFTGALVVVSHDRYFIDRVAENILLVEDGSAEVPPPNDYWIRNANPLLRTLPVSSDATITVNTLAGETSGDSAKDVTVTLDQLAGYHLANHLFWVTVDGGTITKIAEQFLP